MITVVDARRAMLVALAVISPDATWSDAAVPGSPPPALSGLAVLPSGRLVVIDQDGGRLAVVDRDGGNAVVLDPGADPVGTLSGATGVAAGDDGAIYVADTGNGRLVRASGETGTTWSSFGTRGTGATGTFAAPSSVVVDDQGRLVVADPRAGHVVRIDDITGVAWTELALPGAATAPYGLSRDGDRLLLTDLSTRTVMGIAVDGTVTVLVDGSTGDAGRPELVAPIVAVRHEDTVVVADAGAAQLSCWVDTGAGTWTRKDRLAGTPRALPGPEFTRLVGMVAS